MDAIRQSRAFRLAAVCDIDQFKSADFANDDGVAIHEDAAELIADQAVDAVVVDTPVSTHVELCRAALTAGKHVCCEKPLALARGDGEELLSIAASIGVTLFTAFHRRYNNNLPTPGQLRRTGLEAVRLRYLERIEEHTDSLGWYATSAAEGGGCIVDNGPNAYDVLRHLFGDVSADRAEVKRSSSGVDMAADIHGRLADGADVLICLDWTFDGECKDLHVRWADGAELDVDLLAGYPGFKESLAHEYSRILDEFATLIDGGDSDLHGLAATAWLEDVLAVAA